MSIFFDLQVNGFAGVDFQAAELSRAQLEFAVAGLQAHGTSRILLTLITDSVDRLEAKLRHIEALRAKSPKVASTVVGYHLEGPYLCAEPGYRGAHNPVWMKAPDRAEFDRFWTASGGRLRLVTLAPELAGSTEFIRYAVGHGVRVAIGHSNADEASIDAAQEAGLTLCTHLGNGVPGQLPRHDNVVQRLLARDELYACFIPDGIHLPPGVLKNFVRAKPSDKVLFTTDAMSAAGAPPGRYPLGEMVVEVGADRIVRQPGSSNFAGSALTMDDACGRVSRYLGWSETEARAACGARVAAALGYATEPTS